MQGEGGRSSRWWRPVVPVRARVLATVLVMALFGVLVAGGVVYLVQARSLTSSITSSLEQEVAEFRALAETGLDPETGVPFTSIERLLRVALVRVSTLLWVAALRLLWVAALRLLRVALRGLVRVSALRIATLRGRRVSAVPVVVAHAAPPVSRPQRRRREGRSRSV